MKILIVNGPNINMLGIREKEIYGDKTYEDLIRYIEGKAPSSFELEFMQSNHEGDIVDTIQRAYYEGFDGDCYKISDLDIDGKDIISLGFEEGPEVGKVLKYVLDGVIEGRISNDRESIIKEVKIILNEPSL